MQAPLPISALLSLSFGVHIVLVNLDMAIATFIPLMEWLARKKNDDFLMERAKILMRYYASTYAIAGVFGTAFTVMLLSFYPQFIGLAGHLTWVPFGLAILMIALRFLTIVLYWYLWDRPPPQTHLAVGGLMALSGYLIPFGFRAVFAFLNVPSGLHLEPKPYLDVVEALMNPTFLPLYLKSVFGALAAGSLMMVTVYIIRYESSEGSLKGRYLELVSRFANYGFASLALMMFFGAWYSVSLITTPYKFYNIFGSLIGKPGEIDFGWLFIVKMILVLVQFIVLYQVFRPRELTETQISWAKIGGPVALATVLVGEMLNMHSQLPYFVAQPEVVNSLPEIFKQALLTTNANTLANLPELYMITTVFLIPLLAAVVALFYLLLKER
ncbi:MAG: cytochrome ubiquinol oxidase subunit I [Candidatus Korarchaeota archaeon]|nr:cytochrome ubiquinol oxidase subunit I [Candidatus Korarchaeota archaeon]